MSYTIVGREHRSSTIHPVEVSVLFMDLPRYRQPPRMEFHADHLQAACSSRGSLPRTMIPSHRTWVVCHHWLVKDQRCRRYVALKILTTEACSASCEIEVARLLQGRAGRNEVDGQQHVRVFGTFMHTGSNGRNHALLQRFLVHHWLHRTSSNFMRTLVVPFPPESQDV